MSRTEIRRAVSMLTMIAFVCPGCVRTREIKIARYEPGDDTITRAIPQTGVYRVKWKIKDEFKSAPGKPRYLLAGTSIGFETAPDGNVIAVIGDERIDIGRRPRRAKYCCWYQRAKEQTQFAIELREFVGAALLGSAVVGGTVAAFAIDAYLNRDCDRDDTPWRRR